MEKYLRHWKIDILNKTTAKAAIIIVASILSITVTSCSQRGLDYKQTPSEVVIAAYMNTAEDKYLKFKKYLSADALNDIKNTMELDKGIRYVLNKKTRDGTITGIDIVQEEIQEYKAVIAIRVYFKDGYIADVHECLNMEGGQWKMTL